MLSIAFDEAYADVERLNDMDDEGLALLEQTFIDSDPEVEITYGETGYGTRVLVAKHDTEGEDYIDFFSIYRGYCVEFVLLPAKEGDRDLICVIFYSEGNNGDNIEADVKRLLDYGFSFPEADLVSLKTSYTIRDGYITGVEPGTTAASFRARVTLQAAGSWVLTDADGQEKDASSLLQTGDTVRVYAANGIRRYCATVLVYGDVNGDGRINISDLIKVRNHILGEQKLTASFFLTGDVNRDSLINISDLIKIRNHILGENAIPQNN